VPTTSPPLQRHAGERLVDLRRRAGKENRDLAADGFGFRHEVSSHRLGRIDRVVEKADQGGLRHQFAQQVEALGRQLAGGEADTGHIGLRLAETLDETVLHRIPTHREYDRNRRGGGLGDQRRVRPPRW
jgi:hypothetical protein